MHDRFIMGKNSPYVHHKFRKKNVAQSYHKLHGSNNTEFEPERRLLEARSVLDYILGVGVIQENDMY